MAAIVSLGKSVILFLAMGILIPVVHSQPALIFNFENYSKVGLKRWDRIPLVAMDSNHLHKFTLPEDVDVNRAAWGLVTLGSASAPNKNDTLFILFTRYADDGPVIFLDKDQDDNFKEEEPYRWSPGQAPIQWNLATEFTHWIEIEPDRNAKDEEYQFVYRMIAPPYLHAGLPLLPAQYWWIGKRQATRSTKSEINGDSCQVALYDANFDGRYDGKGIDQVWIGDLGLEPHFTRAGGAATLGSDPLIRVGKSVYQVDSISPSGDWLRLMPADQPYPYLYPGDEIGNVALHHLYEGTDSLRDLLHPQKFTLLNVWASWCKGCAAQRPYLLEIIDQHAEKLQVIGLVEDTPPLAQAYAKKHKLPWDNWMLSPEMKEALMVSHYPYYTLISPRGEIMLMDVNLEGLRQYLGR